MKYDTWHMTCTTICTCVYIHLFHVTEGGRERERGFEREREALCVRVRVCMYVSTYGLHNSALHYVVAQSSAVEKSGAEQSIRNAPHCNSSYVDLTISSPIIISETKLDCSKENILPEVWNSIINLEIKDLCWKYGWWKYSQIPI